MTSFSTFACKSQQYTDLIVHSQCFVVVVAFLLHASQAPFKFLRMFKIMLLDDPMARASVKDVPTIPERQTDSTDDANEKEQMFQDHADLSSSVYAFEDSADTLEIEMACALEKELKRQVTDDVHASMQADIEKELLEDMRKDVLALSHDLLAM